MASPLRRLLPYHERYKVPFWAGISGLLVSRVLEAFIPLFLRNGIDAVASSLNGAALPTDPMTTVRWCAAGIALCVAVRFVCLVFSRRVIRRVGVYVAYDLRKRVYDHLQQQGPAFFAKFPTGDLMARAINDINLVRQLIGMGLRTILVIAFAAVVGVIFMAALAPRLTLVLLAPMPIIAVIGWLMSRRVF